MKRSNQASQTPGARNRMLTRLPLLSSHWILSFFLQIDFVHVVVHTATGNSCIPPLMILLREEKKEKKKKNHLTKIAHLLTPSLIPVGKSQGKPTWTQVGWGAPGGDASPVIQYPLEAEGCSERETVSPRKRGGSPEMRRAQKRSERSVLTPKQRGSLFSLLYSPARRTQGEGGSSRSNPRVANVGNTVQNRLKGVSALKVLSNKR